MKLSLRATAALTLVLALNSPHAAPPPGAGDVVVNISFYNSRVVGQTGALSGQVFRAIYAATSSRARVTDKNIVYAIPHDASAPLYNSTQVDGNIVLIDRGFVEFDVQAANAAAAGAAGIIVVNNIGDPAVPSMQQTTSGTPPDVMVSQNDGDIIKAASGFDPNNGVAANLSTVTLEPDIQADRILKLDAGDGNLQWYTLLGNDGALAVDPSDLSVYTAKGGHNYGNNGFVYKLDSAGSPAWNSTISLNSYCNFFYVTNIAVDAFSSNPGVVFSENGCFGALAKSDRGSGAQQWSVLTYDIGRPSIDPATGEIYAVTNAGNLYDAETIYGVDAGGLVSFANSCEGFTDLNPADSQLYRGGNASNAHGCGTTLSQLSTTGLGLANWSMDLSANINSFDSIAVQPWLGGYIYVASVASSKILVVDPVTQTVVTSFNTAVPPKFIAVNPLGGAVYVADDTHPTVFAYGPTGALLWINPNLGGTVTNLATARGLVGTPPSPTATATTTAATSVAPASATLNGTVNPNGSSTTVYFQYGTTAAYGSQTANQVFTGSSAQNVTANVSGLAPNTTYHFRIIAINAGGTITGSDMTFTTSVGSTPTPTPTPNPSATPACPVPTARIASSRGSIKKGETAIISIFSGAGSAPMCQPVTVHYNVKTKAQAGVDFTLTDQFGQDAMTQVVNGPLFLNNLYNSRKKTLSVQIVLQNDSAYKLGNTKATVQLLARDL